MKIKDPNKIRNPLKVSAWSMLTDRKSVELTWKCWTPKLLAPIKENDVWTEWEVVKQLDENHCGLRTHKKFIWNVAFGLFCLFHKQSDMVKPYIIPLYFFSLSTGRIYYEVLRLKSLVFLYKSLFLSEKK